jgi:hypothetical protein
MSEDPKLFDAGDYNLFRYCHNDPVDCTDPMGLTDQQLPPGPTHLTQAIEMDITISERISLWQRSMETSIGGEQALQILQNPQFKDNLTRQLGGPNSALEQSPRFRAFIPFIFRWEGGYSKDRHDPGGETNFGIDARSHPGVDIRHLTKDAAEHIYWNDWGNSRAEGLHYPLGEVHFNAYVNTGPGQAATLLRRSGGSAQLYINAQERFYRNLARGKPNFDRYLRGWINRSEDLKVFLNLDD